MPSIFEAYKSGLETRRAETAAKSTEAFRGLQMDALRSDIRTRKRAAAQARKVEVGVQGYLGGDPEAAGVLQRLGPGGREALEDIKKSEKATHDQALEQAKRANDIYKGLPEDQKAQFQQGMIANFAGSGILNDEQADQLSFMDPASFGQTLDRLTGVKTPTGDFVVYENPDNPDETKNVNEASAEGQKFIADNPDWEPAPKREELRTGVLPAAKADQLQARADANKGAIEQIDFAITALEENRARGGLVGQIKKTAQSFISAMRDFSAATGLEIGDDLASGLANSDVMEFFDPKLPDLQIIENSLAYAVARQRKPNRTLNAQDVKLAKSDTQIMGLTDTDSVIERLTFLRGLIQKDTESVEGRLGIEPTPLPRYRLGKDGKLEKVE
jgi:hypothetical protein